MKDQAIVILRYCLGVLGLLPGIGEQVIAYVSQFPVESSDRDLFDWQNGCVFLKQSTFDAAIHGDHEAMATVLHEYIHAYHFAIDKEGYRRRLRNIECVHAHQSYTNMEELLTVTGRVNQYGKHGEDSGFGYLLWATLNENTFRYAVGLPMLGRYPLPGRETPEPDGVWGDTLNADGAFAAAALEEAKGDELINPFASSSRPRPPRRFRRKQDQG